MKPSLGRIVHVTDHVSPEIPPYAAIIVQCRPRTAEDSPAIDRGKDTVFPEDGHVVHLRVFSMAGEFTLEDVDYATSPAAHRASPRWQQHVGAHGTWSWSWPERV